MMKQLQNPFHCLLGKGLSFLILLMSWTSHSLGQCSVTTHPSNVTICGDYAPGNSYFSVTATGTGLTYQWQVNTGSGFANINPASTVYANSTTSTLTLGGGWANRNYTGYQYRCAITGSGCGTIYSNAAILYVKSTSEFWANTLNYQSVCQNGTVTFTASCSNPTGVTYQWMENRGSGFVNLSNDGIYSGVTSSQLVMTGVTASMHGYTYKAVMSNGCAASPITAGPAGLTVQIVNFNTQPASKTICSGTATSFSVSASASNGGSINGYQWQVNNGGGFTNISNGGIYSGATTTTLNISSGAGTTVNGYQYKCLVSLSGCSASASSNTATLTINTPPTITSHPANVTIWNAGSATMTVASTGTNLVYKWQYKAPGGSFADITDNTYYLNSSTTTLTIQNATTAMSGYIYRCNVKSNDCAGVTVPSNDATLSSYTTGICMVSFDNITGKNQIVFEKPSNITTVDSFQIYREGIATNTYDLLGSIHKNDLSTLLDTSADPSEQPYLYALAVKDTNDVVSPLSSVHKTTHLTINQGVDDTWNLLWNSYEGIDVTTYAIYRGTDLESLSLIHSVSGNVNSFTDKYAPVATNLYYQIEIVTATSCNPTAKLSSSASMKSNFAETNPGAGNYTGISEPQLYPNPARDMVNIKNMPANSSVTIYDMSGRLLKSFQTNTSSFSVEELTNGMYMIELKNTEGVTRIPLVID